MIAKYSVARHVWPFFSLWVRLNETNQDGWGVCCSCKKRLHFSASNAGHYLTKGAYHSLYLDERNVHLQCVTCNLSKGGNQHEYFLLFMEPTYGSGIHDGLVLEAQTPKQYKQFQLKMLRELYRERCKKLAAEKSFEVKV